MTALQIAGIRFDSFSPSIQSKFLFSEEQLALASVEIKKKTRSKATLLLGTCDRIELWCEEPKTEIVEPMLRSLGLQPLTWTQHVYNIPAQESLEHLFCLASGLLSPLFGEDQIICQLQTALERARRVGCASSVVSYLVREAVTTAKHIQTTIDLQVVDQTIGQALIALLSKYEKQPVLVIGSSALARNVANQLVKAGYQVTMTFRDIEKALELMPTGVKGDSYEKRYELLESFDIVVSATKGMEYTITADRVDGKKRLYIDLAPVRDIDPAIGSVSTLKDLNVSLPQREAAAKRALKVIDEAVAKAHQYLTFQYSVHDLQNLAADAASEVVYRLSGVLPKDAQLVERVYETARKAFSHHLYEQQKMRTNKEYLDLSAPLFDGLAVYAGDPEVNIQSFHTMDKQGWRLTRLSFGSHSGTHMDSPAHMLDEGQPLDTYPVSSFFATAYVMGCSRLETITVDTCAALPAQCDAVLFHTQGNAHLSEEAARFLVERGIRIFGFDTPNCDKNGDLGFPIHHLLLKCGALILENLVNLEKIVHRTVELVALPLSYVRADGSPARVVAIYNR